MLVSDHLLWIDDLGDCHEAEAGPKIARLGQLRRLGLQVPDGFAVTAETFRRFFAEAGLTPRIDGWLGDVKKSDVGSLARAAADIQSLIADTPMPAALASVIGEAYEELSLQARQIGHPVAVRSSATREDSATKSFAGQYVTVLGVSGADRVIGAVKTCWSSFFTERALGYLLEAGMRHWESPMAVGVISLVDARSAGVAFSIHPVTGNRSRMVVEGSWGWGEAVVQGLVTPDHVEMDAEDGRVLDYTIADKKIVSTFDHRQGGVVEHDMPERFRRERVLNDAELQSLYQAVKAIEAHYRGPVDVEWVFDRNHRAGDPVHVVQTRPVTAFGREAEQPKRWDPLAYSLKYGMGVR
jgi:pyruvate,water dikinase